MTTRTWLITGVSSGFGRHLTDQLLHRGDRVIGTVRRPDAMADLTARYPDALRVELLDVTDTAACARSWTAHWPPAASTSSSRTPGTGASGQRKTCRTSRPKR